MQHNKDRRYHERHRWVIPNYKGYADLLVDGTLSRHQSDTTLRWLTDQSHR